MICVICGIYDLARASLGWLALYDTDCAQHIKTANKKTIISRLGRDLDDLDRALSGVCKRFLFVGGCRCLREVLDKYPFFGA